MWTWPSREFPQQPAELRAHSSRSMYIRNSCRALVLLLLVSALFAAERTPRWICLPGSIWQLTNAQLLELESGLKTAVERTEAATRARQFRSWSQYRFQYRTTGQPGQGRIDVIGFCDSRGLNTATTPVLVFDGGTCHFEATYSQVSGYFERVEINGDA